MPLTPIQTSISDISYIADLISGLVTVSVEAERIVDSLLQIDFTSMDSEID